MPQITFVSDGSSIPVPVGGSFLKACQDEDGSHDFGPRGQSPATLKGNIAAAAAEIAAFARSLA